MKTHKIKLSCRFITVNKSTSLSEIEQAEPKFFTTKFGKRETCTMHRGCLIVRYTVNSHGSWNSWVPKRRHTSVYLFDTEEKFTSCISADVNNISSIQQAKNLIDRVLAKGSYNYGDNSKKEN